MRARSGARGVLGLALLLGACGPNREPSPDAGPDGSADGTFFDRGPPDIILRDYSLPPLDGYLGEGGYPDGFTTLTGACNTIANQGSAVPAQHVPGPLPAPLGGDIVNGFYVLEAVQLYDLPARDGGGTGGGPLDDAGPDADDASTSETGSGADAGDEPTADASADVALDAAPEASLDASVDASVDSAADASADARRDVSFDFAVFTGRAASLSLSFGNAYGVIADPGVAAVSLNASYTTNGAQLQWTQRCPTQALQSYDGYSASSTSLTLWDTPHSRVETWTRR